MARGDAPASGVVASLDEIATSMARDAKALVVAERLGDWSQVEAAGAVVQAIARLRAKRGQ
jgi:hypothetical protein